MYIRTLHATGAQDNFRLSVYVQPPVKPGARLTSRIWPICPMSHHFVPSGVIFMLMSSSGKSPPSPSLRLGKASTRPVDVEAVFSVMSRRDGARKIIWWSRGSCSVIFRLASFQRRYLSCVELGHRTVYIINRYLRTALPVVGRMIAI